MVKEGIYYQIMSLTEKKGDIDCMTLMATMLIAEVLMRAVNLAAESECEKTF